jgi:uncharacterized membrane protein
MSTVRELLQHFRNKLVAGLIILLPLVLTVIVLRMMYRIASGLLTPAMSRFASEIPQWVLFLIALSIAIMVTYAIGVFASFLLVRRFATFGERLMLRIPLLRSIYGASKQVVQAFLDSKRSELKGVVLVEFPRRGMRAIGFIMGTVQDEHGQPCYKVFIPTTPNPTSGFLEIIRQSEVLKPNMTVEEGIKMVMSGGILGPPVLTGTPMDVDAKGAVEESVSSREERAQRILKRSPDK